MSEANTPGPSENESIYDAALGMKVTLHPLLTHEVGTALLMVQRLESALAVLLAVWDIGTGKTGGPAMTVSRWDDIKSWTLGGLLKEINEAGYLPSEVADQCRAANAERIRFVHHFFIQEPLRFRTLEGQQAAREDVQGIAQLMRSTIAAIRPHEEHMAKALGVTRETVKAQIDHLLREQPR